MDDSHDNGPVLPSRRRVIQQGAALSAAGVLLPGYASRALAQGDELAAYKSARINWRQAEGAEITVMVIPAGYFDNMITLQPQFEALTGIKLRFEKVPPGQIRQKAVLDLSSKTATYATHCADPMYYALYAANKWTDPLDTYLADSKLTDASWLQLDDVVKGWRDANTIDGKLYGMPYDGEVTLQVYRKDLYAAKGLKPAETFDQFVANAAALNDPANRMNGVALRGFAGAGQNMYIYPSIMRAFGGSWFNGSNVVANTPAQVAALDWYVDLLTKYSSPAVRNWNWPDIADAFSAGTVACYIDAHITASTINNPEKSKVIGKIAYARWPKGPTGKRVTSIWNWGFPINAALPEKSKRATWLFILWATSLETQVRTSWKFPGAGKRAGVNRMSIWKSPDFAASVKDWGDNLIPAVLESLEHDTDVDWRPRVPQWPAIGDTVATSVQSALVGQKHSKEALDEAQARIAQIMKG